MKLERFVSKFRLLLAVGLCGLAVGCSSGSGQQVSTADAKSIGQTIAEGQRKAHEQMKKDVATQKSAQRGRFHHM